MIKRMRPNHQPDDQIHLPISPPPRERTVNCNPLDFSPSSSSSSSPPSSSGVADDTSKMYTADTAPSNGKLLQYYIHNCSYMCMHERIMREEERNTTTHLIKIPVYTHTSQVTKFSMSIIKTKTANAMVAKTASFVDYTS